MWRAVDLGLRLEAKFSGKSKVAFRDNKAIARWELEGSEQGKEFNKRLRTRQGSIGIDDDKFRWKSEQK